MSTAPNTRPDLSKRDPVVIGLCGRAGSGKSAAAAYLVRHYHFVNAAFADSLKHLLAEHLLDMGIDHAYLHEPALKNTPLPGVPGFVTARLLMQTFGDAGRAVHADYWVHRLAQRIGLARGGHAVHDRILITDVRYPNEEAWLREHGGVLVMLVRDGAEPVRAHSSEATQLLKPDLTLVNNGPTVEGLHGLLRGAMADLGLAMHSTPWEGVV